MSATEQEKARIRQALFEGANPKGFSVENAAIHAELLAPPPAAKVAAPEPPPIPAAPAVVPAKPKRRIGRRKKEK